MKEVPRGGQRLGKVFPGVRCDVVAPKHVGVGGFVPDRGRLVVCDAAGELVELGAVTVTPEDAPGRGGDIARLEEGFVLDARELDSGVGSVEGDCN